MGLTAILGVSLLMGCADGHGVAGPSGDPALFAWQLPAGVAPPVVPVDNPMSDAKVALGRRLFYDIRLSGNQAFSCASCHRQEFGFADARNVPTGSTGEAHTRNSMGLSNVGYLSSLGWAGPDTRSLEAQALIPMFGDVPVELGLKGREAEVLDRLRGVPVYQSLFRASFPGGGDAFTMPNVTRAIAAFQRTIVSFNAPVDRFRRGDVGAMSESARRGELLFAQRGCPQCHFGSLFTRASDPSAAGDDFANTGLYNLGGTGAYPGRNVGLFGVTGRPRDMGRMRIPSLRNVALTFPYGHDGSVGSLGDVIDNYARGGRLIATGPNAGDGRDSPFRDPRVRPFTVTPQDKADLVAFLRALTDSSVVTNPRFSNPWR